MKISIYPLEKIRDKSPDYVTISLMTTYPVDRPLDALTSSALRVYTAQFRDLQRRHPGAYPESAAPAVMLGMALCDLATLSEAACSVHVSTFPRPFVVRCVLESLIGPLHAPDPGFVPLPADNPAY